jgi:hypothetical protein
MMIKNNFVIILFSLMLAIIFLTTPVFALTYEGSGKWSAYYEGLSEYYSGPDLMQETYNRDFYNPVALNKNECNSYYCLNQSAQTCATHGGTCETYTLQNNEYFTKNDYSLYLYSKSTTFSSGGEEKQIYTFVPTFTNFENLSGKQISFDATGVLAYYNRDTSGSSDCSIHSKSECYIKYGYVNDANVFVGVGDLGRTHKSDFNTTFETTTYEIPSGGENYRFAFQIKSRVAYTGSYGAQNIIYAIIDNVLISETNIGTFNKGYEMPSCNSLENCSNLDDPSKFKSNDERNFYWLVDYIAGGSCSVWENGVFKGNMTERANGIYGYEVESRAFPNEYVDLNLRAECLRVPYEIKGFYAEVRLYEDNNIVTTFNATNSTSDNTSYNLETIKFSSEYLDDLNEPILNATCELNINDEPFSMTYNSLTKKYEYSTSFITLGSKSIKHTCSKTNYLARQDTYNLLIDMHLRDKLVFTPINNISNYEVGIDKLFFNTSSNTGEIIFKVQAINTLVNTPFYFYNSIKDFASNYFVYSSDDGINWAFDDTITFGSQFDYDDAIQKVWETNNYKYEFYINLLGSQTKYYKLVYQDVGKAWETINNSTDWVHFNQPINYLKDNKNWDVYSISGLSEMSSRLKLPFSQLLSGDFVRGVNVQFTAYSTNDITLKVGFWDGDANYVVGDLEVTSTPTRFSVLLNPYLSEEDILVLFSDGDTSASVYITDYQLIPNSYFVDGMTILNFDGSVLNSIFRSSGSFQYIKEGEPFRIKTSAYDIEGDLDRLLVNVYADIGSNVLIGTQAFDLSTATKRGQYFVWDVEVNGVVDLNGNYINPNELRDVFIQARLYNNNDLSVAQISRQVKLLQYPNFQNDLGLQLFNLTNKYGENPKFRINLSNAVPNAFVGLRFIFHKAGVINAPYYEKTIYKSELNCGSLISCQKELNFNEYTYNIVDDVDIISVEFLLNTEHSFTSGLTDFMGQKSLTLKQFPIILGYRQFDTARVFQVYERQNNVYSPDEKIGFVLQLRDIPYRDLSTDISVYANIRACDSETGGSCQIIDQKFLPTGFRFDNTTGYNYFYWNNYFFNDSGELLDQNFIEINVHLRDNSYSHDIVELPVVGHANKCQSASYGTFFNWAGFNVNFLWNLWSATERLLFGCTNLTDPVVRATDPQAQRIFLDSNHVTNGGQNHSIACLNTTKSKEYSSTLNQEMYCVVVYTQSDEQIDKFRFYIANEYSDFSRNDDAEKQYIEIEIPADQIIFEDLQIMAKTLQSEFQVDTLDTIGEVAFYGFDKIFSRQMNPLTDILEGTTKTGLITNIGFDVNWSNTFNPNFVTGMFFITIKDLGVINQQDYIRQYPILEGQDASYFMRWANQERINIPVKQAKINVLGHDFKPLLFFEPYSRLVINQVADRQINVSQDANNLEPYLPVLLTFNFISDMISDNYTKNERLFIPVTFTYLIPSLPFNPANFIEDFFFGETPEGIQVGLFNNPTGFLIFNWFWLFIIGAVVLVGSLIYKNFKGGGNISIYGNNNGGS